MEFFERCELKKIPVLMFSAGLGDIIDQAVRLEKWPGNVHVLSNHLVFDGKEGVATKFKHKNIHTFSKKEVALQDIHLDWASAVFERKNVIVVGDSIGDIHMAEGVKHDCVLKVGFLNDDHLDSLDAYMESFDVVLKEDNSMDFLISLIEETK